MLSRQQLEQLLKKSHTSADAADELLRLYRPMLRLIAEQQIGRGLRRREDGSDIVQRTVLEAFASFDRFQGQSEPEFSCWLKQILRRNIANLVRDNRAAKRDLRREKYLDDGEGSVSVTWMHPIKKQSTPSQHVVKAEAALNLANAIEELPDAQRTAIRMRHLEGCGIDEIATAMGKSPASVAGLIRRGLENLRVQLTGDTTWL